MEYEGRFSTLSWIMLVPVIPAVVMVWLTGLDAPQPVAELELPPFARSAALFRTILEKNAFGFKSSTLEVDAKTEVKGSNPEKVI